MASLLEGFSGNPHSEIHLHGRESGLIVEQARDQVSELIGADPSNVIFTSGATESNNFVIKQAPRLRGGRRTILISAIEHKCVLESAHALEASGYKVVILRTDEEGIVDYEFFRNALSEDVALVSIMTANNEIGTINDITLLIEAAHEVGGLFHTDAAQHISHSDIDVNHIYADFISLSSHKMYGPKGIGAIYIAPHLYEQVEPLIHGGGQQDGKRSGTLSPLLCGGFGAAAAQYVENGSQIRSNTKHLRDSFYKQIHDGLGDRIGLIGQSLENRHIANLSIKFETSSDNLLGQLMPIISASNGSACTSGEISASHVLKAIGLSNQEAEHCIRFSFGVGLSDKEIEIAAQALISAFQT